MRLLFATVLCPLFLLWGCSVPIPINERAQAIVLISEDLGIDGVVINWDVQLPDSCESWYAACTLGTPPYPVYVRPGYGTMENVAHELRHVWQFRNGQEYQANLPYYDRPMEVDAYRFADKYRE